MGLTIIYVYVLLYIQELLFVWGHYIHTYDKVQDMTYTSRPKVTKILRGEDNLFLFWLTCFL
jgi:hypothetical protein